MFFKMVKENNKMKCLFRFMRKYFLYSAVHLYVMAGKHLWHGLCVYRLVTQSVVLTSLLSRGGGDRGKEAGRKGEGG